MNTKLYSSLYYHMVELSIDQAEAPGVIDPYCMSNWCADHFGVTHSHTWQLEYLGSRYVRLLFAQESDRTLFMLTWAS